jgi:hypothetical protein
MTTVSAGADKTAVIRRAYRLFIEKNFNLPSWRIAAGPGDVDLPGWLTVAASHILGYAQKLSIGAWQAGHRPRGGIIFAPPYLRCNGRARLRLVGFAGQHGLARPRLASLTGQHGRRPCERFG